MRNVEPKGYASAHKWDFLAVSRAGAEDIELTADKLALYEREKLRACSDFFWRMFQVSTWDGFFSNVSNWPLAPEVQCPVPEVLLSFR